MTAPAPFHADLAEGPAGGHALWVNTSDGVRIRIGLWPAGEKGTVLLLPGRTEYIEKYGRAAADLAPLASLPCLRRLFCCAGATDLTALTACGRLAMLNLSQSPGVCDLTPLAGWGALSVLVCGSGLVDLSPLAQCPDLHHVDISRCDEGLDLSPLSHLLDAGSLAVGEYPWYSSEEP